MYLRNNNKANLHIPLPPKWKKQNIALLLVVPHSSINWERGQQGWEIGISKQEHILEWGFSLSDKGVTKMERLKVEMNLVMSD